MTESTTAALCQSLGLARSTIKFHGARLTQLGITTSMTTRLKRKPPNLGTMHRYYTLTQEFLDYQETRT